MIDQTKKQLEEIKAEIELLEKLAGVAIAAALAAHAARSAAQKDFNSQFNKIVRSYL